ncbi:hypothetical protein CC85DRAFT_312515 [Cutaneotrichosporon oleaginosum]|uniref:Uncharacterized protein n=1 Tax=Cutaneotrichosporon oleaginosum TaxID=879819 RepID=A0A0J0XLG4_9TREE|nr:uncharacterized protein CC85DRAFT_312515 [Cutaneotrichosporon oleaginosum]KLT41926.1 hypothetical protein CC85DRAFT_312515 [Cutaneotrichosporon oleaginosum]TXT12526.1 hypothetical protein COLE_02936 [Cutaneotrichosporon oleaginosum]
MGRFADKIADRLGEHPAGNHIRGKKWAEILGSALLALGVLALVGVWAAATAGYEATSRFSPNYNLTDSDHWFSKFIPGRTGNLCQPAYINPGQQFRTTNGVFLWEMGKQFNVTMAEVGNNSTMVNFNGTGQQYADNKLEHCDLSGLSIDMDLFQAQVDVKLYATCIDPEWPALLLSQNTYSVDQSRLLDNSLWFTNDLVMKSEYKERNDLQSALNNLAADLWRRQRAQYQTAEMPVIRGIRVVNQNNCGFATDDRKGCYESPLSVSNDSVGFYMFQNLSVETTMYNPQAWNVPTNNFIQSLFAAARYDFAVNQTNNVFVNSTARQAVITTTEDPNFNLTGGLTQLTGAQSFLDGGDFDAPKISRVRTSYLCIVSKMKPPADFAISVLGLAFALFGVVFGAVMMIVSKLTGKELGANPVVAAAAPGAALAQVATNLTRTSGEIEGDPEALNEKNRTADGITPINSHSHKVSDGSGGTAVPQYDSRAVTPAPSYNYGAKSAGAQYTPLKNNQSFDHLSDGTPSPSTTKHGFNSFASLNKLSEQPQMPGSAGAGGAADKGSSSGLAGLAGAAGGGLLGLAGGLLGSKFGNITPKNLSGTNLQGMTGGFGGAPAADAGPGAAPGGGFGGFASMIPGGQNIAGLAGKMPGGANLQNMAGNIPGAQNLQGMVGNVPGASNLQGMVGNVPGAANLQSMAGNIPGASNLQGMVAGVPGASTAGGMASNIPGMPQVSNLATNVPGVSNLQGMASSIPGAGSLQGLPANVPGAQNLTGAGLQNVVAAQPSMAQLGNAQNLAAAPSSAFSGLANAGTAAAAGLAGAGAGALATGAYMHSKDRSASGDSPLYMNSPSTIREVPENGAVTQPPAAAVTPAGAQVFRTPSNSSLKRANAPTSIDLSNTQPAIRATKGLPTSPGAPVRGLPTSPGRPARGIPTSPGAPQMRPLDPTLASVPSAPSAPAVPSVSQGAPAGSSFPTTAAAGLGAGALAAGAGYVAHQASQPKVDESVPQARDFVNAAPTAVPVGEPIAAAPVVPTAQLNATLSEAPSVQAEAPSVPQVPSQAQAPTGLGLDGLAADVQGRVDRAAAVADSHLAGTNIPAAGQNFVSAGQGFIQPAAATVTGAIAGAGGAAILDQTPRSPTVAGPPSFATPGARTAAGAPTTPTLAPRPRDITPMSPTSAGPPAGWNK